MINRLLQKLHRPEKGWDPISPAYAADYAAIAYASPTDGRAFQALLSHFPAGAHPAMLDLGAGPGHNALYFARQGCRVTWHDISSHYRRLAEQKFSESGLPVRFSLGYLEEAQGAYDLILVSQCWNYCLNDTGFAVKLISLLKENGIAFATINNEIFFRNKNVRFPAVKRYLRVFQFLLNDILNVKIGHPFPSHWKITRIFNRLRKQYHLRRCQIERSGHYTVLTIVK